MDKNCKTKQRTQRLWKLKTKLAFRFCITRICGPCYNAVTVFKYALITKKYYIASINTVMAYFFYIILLIYFAWNQIIIKLWIKSFDIAWQSMWLNKTFKESSWLRWTKCRWAKKIIHEYIQKLSLFTLIK